MPREKKKKTLKLTGTKRSKTEDKIKAEIKTETEEDGGTSTVTSFTKNLLEGQSDSRLGFKSAISHREKVKLIKQEYMMKKKERKEAERQARQKRLELIADTKKKLKEERLERIAQNRQKKQLRVR